MSDHAARERVFDLTPEMLFRRGDAIEVVRLDALERMVRAGRSPATRRGHRSRSPPPECGPPLARTGWCCSTVRPALPTTGRIKITASSRRRSRC